MYNVTKYRRHIGLWRCTAIIAIISFVIILITFVIVSAVKNNNSDNIPCPPRKGGLVTIGDPINPSPFHDITKAEYEGIYAFLRKEKKLNLTDPEKTFVNTSSIFMMDLLLPPKKRVLSFVDAHGVQPAREARVMILRGDKDPPVVEEYRVGPLPDPKYVELIVSPKRRNPVEFAVRPMGWMELKTVEEYMFPQVDKQVGHILKKSFGGTFTNCGKTCLNVYFIPLGTELVGSKKRQLWMMTNYPAEYYTLYTVDFGALLNVDGSDPSKWSVHEVWYAGTMYSSLEELAYRYDTDPSINKTHVEYVHDTPDLVSSQRLHGDPMPETPQRPPVQLEPDGKRYSIHHRHVSYMHWQFHFRLSGFTGPQLYDIRFQGNRIAYELGINEIAVFYSGHSPMQSATDFVDSGVLLGTQSRALIPGVDCPEGATFLNAVFFSEGKGEPTNFERAQCVFEQSTGIPLRRHLSYTRTQGSYYGGMPESVLVVRSILVIENYDYIIDFVFNQAGVIEVRALSTGYILTTFYTPEESPYGFRLTEQVVGNLHNHVFHFKADLDIGGTSNRYETLDIREETVPLKSRPSVTYRQTRFQRHLYHTEDDAVFHFNFSEPRYHIVHNDKMRTKYGDPRAFRLHLAGIAKQLLSPGQNNEKSISWARQQLAVTVHNDDEPVSSSPYAMFDSLQPVTDFSSFIDGQSIVDQDLVFWITLGTHHIPHTEDIPVTHTANGHLAFMLLPYNYFPQCPSLTSRDNIRVEYVKRHNPAEGLKVEQNGNKESGVCGALTMEQLVRERPDDFVETHRIIGPMAYSSALQNPGHISGDELKKRSVDKKSA